jgi:hypothetical protein
MLLLVYDPFLKSVVLPVPSVEWKIAETFLHWLLVYSPLLLNYLWPPASLLA